MSLIIAIFLIIILLCRIAGDKSKSAEYDRRRADSERSVTEWESLYVDAELEMVLNRCISERSNYDAVFQEVSQAFSATKHWNNITKQNFPLNSDQSINRKIIGKNHEVALDIMLANRGKISKMAAIFGYRAELVFGDSNLKEKSFEYADIILNILRSQGKDVKLCYHRNGWQSNYIWEGSRAYSHIENHIKNDPHNEVLEFSRDLLDQRTDIPPV